MHGALEDMGWAVIFCALGAIVGIVLVLLAMVFVPRLLEKITPNIDEEKEIARGNRAVAEYYGRVAAAAILGMSIVVAAAILGGILAGLH